VVEIWLAYCFGDSPDASVRQRAPFFLYLVDAQKIGHFLVNIVITNIMEAYYERPVETEARFEAAS
jgi:hypothetical protein